MLAHPFEVPSDAMYMAELSLGSVSVPGEGLKVNTWGGAVSEIKSEYSRKYTENQSVMDVNSMIQ